VKITITQEIGGLLEGGFHVDIDTPEVKVRVTTTRVKTVRKLVGEVLDRLPTTEEDLEAILEDCFLKKARRDEEAK
jgi:hypothetical protein